MLIVTPWTGFWVRNYFAQAWPWLGAYMFNPYLRGAVTGIGVMTMIAGVRELIGAFTARRQVISAVTPIDSSRP